MYTKHGGNLPDLQVWVTFVWVTFSHMSMGISHTPATAILMVPSGGGCECGWVMVGRRLLLSKVQLVSGRSWPDQWGGVYVKHGGSLPEMQVWG